MAIIDIPTANLINRMLLWFLLWFCMIVSPIQYQQPIGKVVSNHVTSITGGGRFRKAEEFLDGSPAHHAPFLRKREGGRFSRTARGMLRACSWGVPPGAGTGSRGNIPTISNASRAFRVSSPLSPLPWPHASEVSGQL